MNEKLEQLFAIIGYKIGKGQLSEIVVGSYKIKDSGGHSKDDFKQIMNSDSLRKKFWDDYNDVLAQVGAISPGILTFAAFDKYYDIEEELLDDLSPVNKATYELLKQTGWEKTPPSGTSCVASPGYKIKKIDRVSGGFICMQKMVSQSTTYPIGSDFSFYCIHNNKYYNNKFPLRNTLMEDVKADRIEIDGFLYFIYLTKDNKASLRDAQNVVRWSGGTWECIDDRSYKIIFPTITVQSSGVDKTYPGMTLTYEDDVTISKT